MSALIRIYTRLGKEHVCYAKTFSIHREQSNTPHVEIIANEDKVTEIKHLIKAGQPCNVHIRFESFDIEGECTLDGCTVCDKTNRILCPDPKTQLVRYQKYNRE